MLDKLACALGRNDEQPNIALAVELAATKNRKGVAKIVEGLRGGKRTANDCIKVLYEVAERAPSLVADYVDVFLDLLASRTNRLVWGAMSALSFIAPRRPKDIFDRLDAVLRTYEKGSVITVDTAVSVFAGVAKAGSKYEKKIFPIILKHLETCRPKEVGQHAERAFVCVTAGNAAEYEKVLARRLTELSAPQKKRVGKMLGKAAKLKAGG